MEVKIMGIDDITQAKKKKEPKDRNLSFNLCPLNPNLMGTEDSIEKIWLEI